MLISDLAKEQKKSKRELAKYLGITEPSLHKMIRNNSTRIDTLERIAKFFNVSTSFFFTPEALTREYDISKGTLIPNEAIDNLLNYILVNAIKGKGVVYLSWDGLEKRFIVELKDLKEPLTPMELAKIEESIIERQKKVNDRFGINKE